MLEDVSVIDFKEQCIYIYVVFLLVVSLHFLVSSAACLARTLAKV